MTDNLWHQKGSNNQYLDYFNNWEVDKEGGKHVLNSNVRHSKDRDPRYKLKNIVG